LTGAIQGHHSAIGMLSHPVSFCTYSQPLMEPCLERMVEQRVPIYNADQWLDFIDRRAAVQVKQRVESDGTLSCELLNARGRLTLMVPQKSGQKGVGKLIVNGASKGGTVLRRLEQDYLFVEIDGAG